MRFAARTGWRTQMHVAARAAAVGVRGGGAPGPSRFSCTWRQRSDLVHPKAAKSAERRRPLPKSARKRFAASKCTKIHQSAAGAIPDRRRALGSREKAS